MEYEIHNNLVRKHILSVEHNAGKRQARYKI